MSKSFFWPVLSGFLIGSIIGFAIGYFVVRKQGDPAVIAGAVVGAVVDTLSARLYESPLLERRRQQALRATMEADLMIFKLVQRTYYEDHATYGSYLDIIGASLFEAAEGVSIETNDVSENGWMAVATHADTKEYCAIFVGTAPLSDAMGLEEGKVRCW